MKYAIAFIFLSVGCLIFAFTHRGIWWLFLWPAFSFAIVAFAYGWSGPKVLGKQSDGTLSHRTLAILLPYFLFTWISWYSQRACSSEAAGNEIADGIWIGRRPFAGEVPPGAEVVDLTAEFPESRAVIEGRKYTCLPILDATAGDFDAIRLLVDRLAITKGIIYIHCAQGHGRSATVAAALLLRRGIVNSVDSAMEMIQRARPAVRLSRRQRELVRRFGPSK